MPEVKAKGKAPYHRREVEAAALGFRVDDTGQIHGLRGPVNGTVKAHGYRMISWRGSGRICYQAMVHRLVAYQKFGEQIYDPAVEVRHLNGDPLDNRPANIGIGSHVDNMMDRPAADRASHAGKAAQGARRLTDVEVRAMRESGGTVKGLARQYGLAPSTVSYILRGLTCREAGGPLRGNKNRP